MPRDTTANSLFTAMATVAKKLGAIGIFDVPGKSEDALAFQTMNNSDRIYLVWPRVKVSYDDKIKPVPASPYAAGVLAKINFWESPSNQPINGILGTEYAVSFSLDDATSLGQLLNSKHVATVVRQDGFRLWGARGAGDFTNLKTHQIQKVRIADAIREAILSSHRWAVAKGITANYLKAVQNSVKTYLDDLKSKGAIAGGDCVPDGEQNTTANLFQGKVYWRYSFTPTPVAETLYFIEEITDSYLTKIGA
nr:phage tail sheath C-terminal domain-containing protein [Oligoflexus tunisiensis]